MNIINIFKVDLVVFAQLDNLRKGIMIVVLVYAIQHNILINLYMYI